jgi:hypothetical protein
MSEDGGGISPPAARGAVASECCGAADAADWAGTILILEIAVAGAAVATLPLSFIVIDVVVVVAVIPCSLRQRTGHKQAL